MRPPARHTHRDPVEEEERTTQTPDERTSDDEHRCDEQEHGGYGNAPHWSVPVSTSIHGHGVNAVGSRGHISTNLSENTLDRHADGAIRGDDIA